MKEKLKGNKGITLIALVITIIVLLILAGVSIAMLTGDNGILTQANEAKKATEQGTVEEMVSLAISGLQTKYLGDTSKITPQEIAEQVNKDNNRTDVTASSSTFPTEIEFDKEKMGVPVNKNLKISIYSEDINESQIAPQELFDYEIIQETETNIEEYVETYGLPQKKARITRIKPEYCNKNGYNPDTGKNDLTDTNYRINYQGITDTLIIPYQLEINGEMYKVAEVDLSIVQKGQWGDGDTWDATSSLPLIENIIYPNTVEKILFNHEYTWNGIRFDKENGFESTIKKVILSENTKEIPEYFFAGGEKIQEIKIPNKVTNIGDNAFEDCTSLTEISISSSVTEIGNYAFQGCKELSTINISASVTKIGRWAFSECNSLKNINIAKPENTIEGAPWEAHNATVNWNYQGK